MRNKYTSVRFEPWITAFLVCFTGFLVTKEAVFSNRHIDLFLYRAGAGIGVMTGNPYNRQLLKEFASEQCPAGDENSTRLIENCAFLLTPQSILLFSPLYLLPWTCAKALWSLTIVCTGAWTLRFALLQVGKKIPPLLISGILGVLFMNPMTVLSILGGQTTLLAVTLVLLGQHAWDSGRRQFSLFLWAMVFIKPHVALPLLPLAWYLSGYQRALGIFVWVIVLNLTGCLVCGRSPLLMVEYLTNVSVQNASIVFNRVETSPRITSWNRLLYVFGGPAYNLSPPATLIGYAVYYLIVCIRVRIAGQMPSRSWVFAAASTSMPICCQRLDYELVMLTLTAPLVIQFFTKHNGNRYIAVWLTGLFVLISLPYEVAEYLVPRCPPDSTLALAVSSYHAIFTMLFGIAILIAGWPMPRRLRYMNTRTTPNFRSDVNHSNPARISIASERIGDSSVP